MNAAPRTRIARLFSCLLIGSILFGQGILTIDYPGVNEMSPECFSIAASGIPGRVHECMLSRNDISQLFPAAEAATPAGGAISMWLGCFPHQLVPRTSHIAPLLVKAPILHLRV